MLVVTSRALGAVRHGFSTRRGGVSTGRYATLNVGGKWGDDPEAVAHNRRRLAAAGGFDWARLYTAKQVHGARVALVVDGTLAERVAETEADVVVTAVPGAAVGVYTADCVPILVADDEGRVAAAHAGWRGTVQGVAVAAVEALVSIGARRERLRAAVGPSICAHCFEVGDEVAAQFDALVPSAVLRAAGQKAHVDLWEANRRLLTSAGVAEAAIDAHPPCTMCEPDRFFSFRRDGAGIGQHLSFVVAAPAGA
jgi:purine-nucleoside/S-methyl-5'-thioadenosine phosphorylase / adenosine deaminase